MNLLKFKTMKSEITIDYLGVVLTIVGTYIPGEKEITYFDDLSGSPAYPHTFELDSVFAGDTNITRAFYDSQLDEIVELVLDTYE